MFPRDVAGAGFAAGAAFWGDAASARCGFGEEPRFFEMVFSAEILPDFFADFVAAVFFAVFLGVFLAVFFAFLATRVLLATRFFAAAFFETRERDGLRIFLAFFLDAFFFRTVATTNSFNGSNKLVGIEVGRSA
jgi:hypothetical protein